MCYGGSAQTADASRSVMVSPHDYIGVSSYVTVIKFSIQSVEAELHVQNLGRALKTNTFMVAVHSKVAINKRVTLCIPTDEAINFPSKKNSLTTHVNALDKWLHRYIKCGDCSMAPKYHCTERFEIVEI
jgi:hypothetical protein